jgi:hypothetical protein
MRQLARRPVAAAEPIGRDNGAFQYMKPDDRDGSAQAMTAPGTAVRNARAPGRGKTWLRACRFYLMSLLYGAAVYGFVVAYLLALGAMTEPMPYYAIR